MYNVPMFRRNKVRVPIAWALLFAVLFNIALPSLAMSMRPAEPLGLGEICSTSGLKIIVASGADRAPGDHGDLLHDGHCQLCATGLADFLLPDMAWTLPTADLPSHASISGAPSPTLPIRGLLPPAHAPPALS